VQLLAPDAHPIHESAAVAISATTASSSSSTPVARGLADRVAALESEVATLRAAIGKLAAAVGEANPLESADNSGITENVPAASE
jgi:uncharacterized protein YceH (UPF0502 family)